MKMILINIFKILLGIIFLKSSVIKTKKPYQFYKAFEDYKFLKNSKLLLIFTTLLIVLEQLLCIFLIIPSKPIIFFSLGVLVQLFYILLLFLNLGRDFKNNCECFSLNAPAVVTGRNISINIFLLISIFIIYGCLIRY
ncbi:MauE/DoxX family redox-associated membrane protein [Priestia megaterium]|uniref:MauE/DoxX family redox-associated membrane protein n=1 Tax=Priestia megaterium TaxID=1404 RepID=UPI00338DB0E1